LQILSASSSAKQLSGGLIVFVAMLLLFLPQGSPYFVYGVFVSTVCMMGVTLSLTKFTKLFRTKLWTLGLGASTAGVLYGVFYAGNSLIQQFKPLGIQASSESAIYSLISSHPIELQIAILAFDAIGFEFYFRGNLQNRFTEALQRPIAGIFLSAFFDACIHLISLNPLWVITTFIADSVWGVTYYSTKDLSSSIASHFIWDLAIFVAYPIR
jgi:membrane protease YdiL (CAAX protease family)